MRIAVIDKEKCKPDKCGFVCGKVCPKNRAGEKCIELEEKAVIDESICIGCGICIKKCPFDAIEIINTPETLEEKPVHRFGKNGFVLFRLPFPEEGKVVGLLGKNGLGKTTAVKILSGQLKPNFGEDSSDWLKELKESFRGTELMNYIEKLEEGKLKTVVKPQQVDMIRALDTTPEELLEKYDERNVKEEVIELLELNDFLSRKLNSLSGGELQRVAIAIAYLRKADLYLFDEPSSYLDVKQRLNAGKLIRRLSGTASVIVVEHDLSMLDFVADRVHIFYGAPGVFGIVSKPYSVKNGINAFLEGYIKEDNVRIHEPVRFEKLSRGEVSGNVMIRFSELEKAYSDFKLSVEKGEIREGEILGIFGCNGLGKTTFAKIIAGVEKPDKGEVECNVKISYKPQYLDEMFKTREITVEEIFGEKLYSETFRKKFLVPLELEKLLKSPLSSLSGGELQRVAIALCLSKEADVYLLDEPSAFLDAVQRMKFFSLIQKFSEEISKPIMLIDHDILLLSFADRAMLFEGVPARMGVAKFYSTENALNEFLKKLGITFRRDAETGRPRANKPGSQKDEEQKKEGKYFLG